MGNSLAVQWLGLGTFTTLGPGGRSLVRELRSCKPRGGTAKKKKKKKGGVSMLLKRTS